MDRDEVRRAWLRDVLTDVAGEPITDVFETYHVPLSGR